MQNSWKLTVCGVGEDFTGPLGSSKAFLSSEKANATAEVAFMAEANGTDSSKFVEVAFFKGCRACEVPAELAWTLWLDLVWGRVMDPEG